MVQTSSSEFNIMFNTKTRTALIFRQVSVITVIMEVRKTNCVENAQY